MATVVLTEVNVRTWNGFLRRLSELPPKNLHFRGHGDARWTLETTLERRGLRDMLVEDYFHAAIRARSPLETLTGRRFDVPTLAAIRKQLRGYDDFSLAVGGLGKFPAYDYLIYLRHHGFPSPLLDWTRSAYIAAYFAFADDRPRTKKRSIYVWRGSYLGIHGTNRPELKRLGPFVTAHPRHVLQQSDYTICPIFKTGDKWRFMSHERAFTPSGPAGHGTVLKFNIPSSERLTVLRFLDSVNLNAYSLFGSEESLLATLAVREFDLRPDGLA